MHLCENQTVPWRKTEMVTKREGRFEPQPGTARDIDGLVRLLLATVILMRPNTTFVFTVACPAGREKGKAKPIPAAVPGVMSGNAEAAVPTVDLDALWYIHGRAYDLTQFLKRHPGESVGGAVAIYEGCRGS